MKKATTKDFSKLIRQGLAGIERGVKEIVVASAALQESADSWKPRAMKMPQRLKIRAAWTVADAKPTGGSGKGRRRGPRVAMTAGKDRDSNTL